MKKRFLQNPKKNLALSFLIRLVVSEILHWKAMHPAFKRSCCEQTE